MITYALSLKFYLLSAIVIKKPLVFDTKRLLFDCPNYLSWFFSCVVCLTMPMANMMIFVRIFDARMNFFTFIV